MAAAFTAMLNLAMHIEHERHVSAHAYERPPERGGYPNGYKPKKLDTLARPLTVLVPKSRGRDAPFYPQALERNRPVSAACRSTPWSEASRVFRRLLNVGRSLPYEQETEQIFA